MPIYCELPIWGTLFEPLNAISNLAFIVAAFFLWQLGRGVGEAQLRRQVMVLAVLIALVGVGSFLWHFFRTPWSLAADVIPIQLFLLTFTWFLLRGMHWSLQVRFGVFVGFVATSMFGGHIVGFLMPALASGGGYAAALIFAFVLSYFIYLTDYQKGTYFFITLLIFSVSLLARQLDVPLCSTTHGHGLHLFWHILNGYVLYRFARTLVIKSPHLLNNAN